MVHTSELTLSQMENITMTTSTQFVAQLQKDNEALFEASKMNVKAYFESKDNSM